MVGRYPYYGRHGTPIYRFTADRTESVGIPERARHGIDKPNGHSAILLLKTNTSGVASSSRLGNFPHAIASEILPTCLVQRHAVREREEGEEADDAADAGI